MEELVSPFISQEIKKLLGYVTSSDRTEAEYQMYVEAHDRKLYNFNLEEKIVGCIGVEFNKNQLEIKHIAVLPEARGESVGSRMIEAVQDKHSPKVIVAETDEEAVGFYRKIGFEITSLGEKYPGVERFWCEKNIEREQQPLHNIFNKRL